MSRIGTKLGHYEITAKLGEGGMGEVFRAHDTKLGRDVAIKVLPAAFSEDAERLERFEREAKLLAQLHHPNIASIFGVEESGGALALVMELVEGPTLAERLAQGAPPPVEETVAIARQVAEALEEAHERGIVHRDLKPQNVKVTVDGKVKVLDFGLAKAMDAASAGSAAPDLARSPTLMHSPTLTAAGTQLGMILGTAAYMSPEQAKGKPVDRRADIWAFGVVVWEMLVGRQLFAGETVQETLGLVMLREPDLAALPAATPPRLRALVARCLERDPKRRLRDIGEARVALERLAAGDDGEPAAQAERPRAGGWRLVAAALLGGLIAAGALWLLRPAAPLAPLRKLDLAADGVDSMWLTAPALSPDGARIAYNARNAIWVRDLDDLVPRQLAAVNESSPIIWAPDGRSLAYVDRKKLWRVGVEGGRAVAVADLPDSGQAIGGSWRADGTIAIAVWRGGLYTVPADGGRPALLFEHDLDREIDYHYPSWLPDGRLLFAAHRNLEKQRLAARGSGRPAAALEEMELGVLAGGERVAIDWGASTDLQWPTFDPEDELLLYTRNEPSAGIWARPVDPRSLAPRGEEFLLVPEAQTLSLGGDGSLLYVEGEREEGEQELVWVDRSGQVLSVLGPPQAGLAEPALSPDGRRLAATARVGSSRDVWLFDLERHAASRLTFEDSDESEPRWTPDSRRLVYGEIRGMASTIVMREATGSGERQELVAGTGYGMWGAQAMLSPDGRHLLFSVDEGGALHLRIAPIGKDGTVGEARRFFPAETAEPDVLEARISPDGRLLAYRGNDSGQPEVYLTRFPTGEGLWQVSSEGGRLPRWAAGTGELFYIAGSGPVTRFLVAVPVESEREVVVGAPERLFAVNRGQASLFRLASGYDVSADGSRFVVVRASGETGPVVSRMILLENWRRLLDGRTR